MKSSFLATERISASVMDAFRLSLLAFGFAALTIGAGTSWSMLASASACFASNCFAVFGSLDGCVGLGAAKKYECERASLHDIRLRGSYVKQRERRLSASAVAAVKRSRRGGFGNCPTGQ